MDGIVLHRCQSSARTNSAVTNSPTRQRGMGFAPTLQESSDVEEISLMNADGKHEPSKTLNELLDAADAATLRELVEHLLAKGPHLQRECIDFLMERLDLTPAAEANAKAEAMFALWDELEPDLADLDRYGGGPEEVEHNVAKLLEEVAERVADPDIERDDRWQLLDKVFPYIKSRNSGMCDHLYSIAYAACHDDEDLRDLAREFEKLGTSWSLENARDIYRELGDREKYLSLRMSRMEFGTDYYDLATFYWDTGERDKALEVAREGLAKATGNMTDLRRFVAERALEAGNRGEYLELKFAEAIDGLSLGSYKSFKELCTPEEWEAYEPRLLKALEHADGVSRLEIFMEREDYDQALSILMHDQYSEWRLDTVMRVAEKLERRYPDQILTFYRRRLGSLDRSASRKEYARNAAIVKKLRHMWVDIMNTPEEWLKFARVYGPFAKGGEGLVHRVGRDAAHRAAEHVVFHQLGRLEQLILGQYAHSKGPHDFPAIEAPFAAYFNGWSRE